MKISASLFLLFMSLAGLSLHAAAAAPMVSRLAQPDRGGLGVVICEPVTANSLSRSFGAGCAVWLQVVVGGQPQFGKTPLWGSLDRVRRELRRTDLQLSPAEVLSLAPILGVTHAVVGTLQDAEPNLTLTYRLLQVPSGVTVGAAITLTGTQTGIAAGLPQMARTLVKELGGTTDSALSSPTADDLQMIGQVRWRDTPDTDAQRTAIKVMAVHDPVAGLLNLTRKRGGHTPQYHSAVEALLTQAGDNTFAWAVITQRDNVLLLPHAAQLSALTTRYPRSSSLAMIESLRWQLTQDHKQELEAAQRSIKNAPLSPDGWLIYSQALADVAAGERQGRTYGALSASEADDLGRLYARAETAALKAVRLDPKFAEAWENLAVAATFNSNNSNAALADHALQTALALSGDKRAVYYWALQMYQPKWNGDPAKLDHFAHLAAADTSLTVDDVVILAPELGSCGYPEMQAKMLTDFIARQRAILVQHPDDGQAHFELAVVQDAMDAPKEALAEYQRAAALLPEDSSVQYRYGAALDAARNYDQAEAPLRVALKIDPDFPEAHYCLSEVLQLQNSGKDAEAKRELKTTLVLDPTYGKAYRDLAVFSEVENNPAEAISLYQSAIQFGDISRSNYGEMIDLMSTTRRYKLVTTAGASALSLYGDAMLEMYPAGTKNLYDLMADAYLHQKKWGKALVMCQSAVQYDTNDAAAQETRAEAYLGQGRIADARAGWKKVLTLKDDQQKALAQEFLKKYP